MTESRRPDVRNIAIIAHVDHGKTTLVDAMLKQTGEFKAKADEVQECVMDSNDLERERGITILAKNTSVPYLSNTINIVDTPGHADFGSEVERTLTMVDGVLLLVDAYDGPMPQTRFVLKKALELGLNPIVVINKVDRPGAKPHEALDKTFALFVDLGATDPQLDFPIVYASGRDGWASFDAEHKTTDLKPLFETIIKHVPGPTADQNKPLQMLVTILGHDNFVGRIASGRIFSGRIQKNMPVTLIRRNGQQVKYRITKILRYFGMTQKEMESAEAGDIVAVAGVEEANVGDTIASADNPVALQPMNIDEPTLVMEFMVNDSPFAGQDGEFLTTRHLRDRLLHEQEINVGLRVEEIPNSSSFRVSGRGELHLSILIETMRREGFELAVSKPEVIDKEIDGKKMEPAEYLVLDIEDTYRGATLESLGARGAELKNMNLEGNRLRLEYVISARALIGFKSEFLTFTRGNGLMHHSFHGYIPRTKGERLRSKGVLIAQEAGTTTAYALESTQERGMLFVGPATPVYGGMIVGESSRDTTLTVNPCKKKALTNMRASGSDDAAILTPHRQLTLEQAIEFIETDELVEVTPKNIRLRKKILDHTLRKRFDSK
ncbi:MAG: GTP-binding protein TypA/BipA [Elusimicrobia bacterium]|nr:GTP-binding protein TypA/BipA [Elusimicrobiota bacterium]